MEGVTDYPMRRMQSALGGFTYCITEFIRVSGHVLNAKTFKRHIPEWRNDFRTDAGMSVQVQLLGGNPERLAASALVAVNAGARAIDLNFGCPAPTVNKHDGGATLLKHPDRLEEIVRTVRARLPSEIPVSAKLRLGWDDPSVVIENALRAERGGASWITIHARTKMQGYQPPVYWKWIGDVRSQVKIPVVANGDIWTIEDFERCREITGAKHFMLGRGALANPALPLQVAERLGILESGVDPNPDYRSSLQSWIPMLREFARVSIEMFGRGPYVAKRVKQWLRYSCQVHKTP
jgi:tRNA-dihydrouridine synthase C